MTIDLQDEAGAELLTQLRDSAVDFTSRASPLARARALRGTQSEFDRQFWNEMVRQGWMGLLVEEPRGGYGQGFAAAATVIDALAANVVPEPFVHCVVFAGRLIELSGRTAAHDELLEGLVTGQCLPVVAVDEEPAASKVDLVPRSVVAKNDSRGWRITGRKFNVRAAAGADGFLVPACMASGETLLCWVRRDAAGVQLDSRLTADGGESSSVTFAGVSVAARDVLAQGAEADAALARAFDETLVMTSVELHALQCRMFDMSMDYLRSRVQFGRAIGTFQALQHRAVDLLIQKELTAASLDDVVQGMGTPKAVAARGRDASRVKARASAAGLQIAKESIQLHGAIGVTDEYDLGLYVQRAVVLSAWLGNAWMHRRRYAQLAGTEGLQ